MFILLLCEVILDAKWFAWCQRAAGGRVSLGSILVPTPMRPPGTANCRAFFSAKSDMMPELGSFKSREALHYLGVWMDLGYFGLIVIYLMYLRQIMAGDGRWWQMSRWRQMMVDDRRWWWDTSIDQPFACIIIHGRQIQLARWFHSLASSGLTGREAISQRVGLITV